MKHVFLVTLTVAACWSSSAGPMAIFSRAQLKYGANRDDFIHRWYERPLHQDTAFQASDDGHFLSHLGTGTVMVVEKTRREFLKSGGALFE